MASYLTPGIYVEEVSTGARPLEAVGTSTAAFLGVAPAAEAHLNEAVPINDWSQFVRRFVREDSPSTPLARAVFGFFNNGGGRCYVVNVGADNPIASDARSRKGIRCLEELDEVAVVAAPGYSDAASYEALLSHCEKLEDRVAILDAPEQVDDIDALKEAASVAPEAGSEAGRPAPAGSRGRRPRVSDGGYGAFYFPWIIIRDPLAANTIVNTPPSGHLAGVYARTDALRGVHKAPANEPIRGALGLTYQVTREEQGTLNQAGVNCIRYFPRAGIRVWGARTVADSASEWRYINVRRLTNMIKESIAQGTRWTVFEPNDETLWKSITRDVRAFLTSIWRDGALLGVTPEQAFFVKCDAETNPPEVIDAGRVVILIGIAPVKPAEFIIFRIGQWAGGVEAETVGAGSEQGR